MRSTTFLFSDATPFGIDEPLGRDLPKALFDANGVLGLLLDRVPFSQVLLLAVFHPTHCANSLSQAGNCTMVS